MTPSKRTVVVITASSAAAPLLILALHAVVSFPSWVGTVAILPMCFLLGMYLHELDKIPEQLVGPPEGHDG